MSDFAYWITPKGEILKPDIRHIGTVIKYPEWFGETDKSIKDTFEKHKEDISSTMEGKAREEIILRLIKRGFIRIRKGESRSNQKWSIQLWKLNPKVNDDLWAWARKLIDDKIERDKFADVYIHQLINNKMTQTSLNKIASGGTITETKIYKECEVPLTEKYFDYAPRLYPHLSEEAQKELQPYMKGEVLMEKYIVESSLSRLYKHNEEHDCGALTAFRKARNCGDGELYTDKEKKQRNKSLLTKLLTKGYGVTKLKGVYPEGGENTTEDSYFVVDIKNTGSLEKDLRQLGEEFEQDSILFIPKGTVLQEDHAYLIGTNHCPDNWIGYGKKVPFEKGRFGYNSKIYTSFVNGRPFIFEEVIRECRMPGSGMGNWAIHSIAKMDWKDIDV